MRTYISIGVCLLLLVLALVAATQWARCHEEQNASDAGRHTQPTEDAVISTEPSAEPERRDLVESKPLGRRADGELSAVASDASIRPDTEFLSSRNVTIKVLDNRGRPAAGISVTASLLGQASSSSLAVVTNNKGEAALKDVPPGRWRFSAQCGCSEAEVVSLVRQVQPGDTATVVLQSSGAIPIDITENVPSDCIYGSVTDMFTRVAIANMTVAAHSSSAEGRYRSFTACDGTFSLGPLPLAEEWVVEVATDDREYLAASVDAVAAGGLPLLVRLQRKNVFEVEFVYPTGLRCAEAVVCFAQPIPGVSSSEIVISNGHGAIPRDIRGGLHAYRDPDLFATIDLSTLKQGATNRVTLQESATVQLAFEHLSPVSAVFMSQGQPVRSVVGGGLSASIAVPPSTDEVLVLASDDQTVSKAIAPTVGQICTVVIAH